ncbi:ExeM/NucH family extracellular endonuclease [Lysinibacter sp. HNR]|uniref:ExeM/NucH family extracellular endonuclease n=1 Tax=Lysinibacter sp. HNR TaxID=3031408 RepID=UPI002434E3C6|nr:ExeM/NucH family extracellular endonuclease [Lysinibacter sp. HNR]WGD36512.1 ExeM/NucH family extracellular endonuclease [Lysinibacter sp. HNR]
MSHSEKNRAQQLHPNYTAPLSKHKGKLRSILISRPALAVTLILGLLAAPFTVSSGATTAHANTDGTGVIINEVYLKGGSANAVYNQKFIELYNPTQTEVSLGGWSLQYRAGTNTAPVTSNNVAALSGTIPAEGYFLVAMSGNGSVGADLPTPDLSIGLNPSGTLGQLFLSSSTEPLTVGAGSLTGLPAIQDFLGYGANAAAFEGSPALVTGANSVPNSLARTNFVDTDNNQADFTHPSTITPQSATNTDPEDPTTPPIVGPPVPPPAEKLTIAQVRGTGALSPYQGKKITTSGVVTATYPTGGYSGYYIQTPGTGGDLNPVTHTVSDAIFVFSGATVGHVAIGDHVEITGTVGSYQGLAQVTVSNTSDLVKTSESVVDPVPARVSLPATEAQRKAFEGMLMEPQGDFTVTNTHTTNQYAEIGLAAGATPLITPTEIARPGSAEYAQVVADNAARSVTLDDGSSTNFLTTSKDTPLPYLSSSEPVSVGSSVTFNSAVIFDYRNGRWKFQPTTQLTAENAASTQPVKFSNVRTPEPNQVGGTIKLSSFNVLNYFTTTGDSIPGCSFYNDRQGNKITVRSGCDARGAADAQNLSRQQEKIVTAINTLDADVVALEEIENSAKFGKDRDNALSTLTAALNSATTGNPWAYVPSPSTLPPLNKEDVIRTAFIYKEDVVAPVGESRILTEGTAFNNARKPLAQQFAAKGDEGGETFIAIANHFKSKGSGSGADADTGDGQGASNHSRVAQANALIDFSEKLQQSQNTNKVFLLGDFNAYSQEDPLITLADAGYTDLGAATGKYTYSFDGASGSLDHILASEGAAPHVAGADIWNINAGESIALEYSRYNYNATNFYDTSPYRSSDHDPIIVGIDLNTTFLPDVPINLLSINDFHGRIDSNTVKFAGTVEQLRQQHGDANTLMLSAGDNIGASLFASSIQQDQPTIDVLNALDLRATAVGNHEFDTGFTDLVDRVIGPENNPNALFSHLGANVYARGTTDPVLDEYALFDVEGITVGVIGAVTEETPTLVSPGGITDLSFGDPVDAVNRVAEKLTDGNPENGQADVLIAVYHEGAGAGTPDGATLEQEVAAGGAFAKIVTETTNSVGAIFTGHSHKQYAWDAPIPGKDGQTRPILQTGNYGENVGQVVLSVSPDSKEITDYTANNVPRTTTNDVDLITSYPRVAEVKSIVDAALSEAAVIGNQPVGTISSDITTAFSGGSYVNGVYTGGDRDNRAAESALGNLVADSLVSSLSSEERGGATIGVVNPGGLRADLRYGADGVITYAQANAVLPFVNNLWTTSLTGAQFKAALEQQWQTDAQGNVPSSRPFLKLGLSQNVQYTFDESRAQGDRVTGIWIDHKPIDATASYRIGSFSFLLQGGDNFRVFTQGTNTRDSGLVDRDAWIDYLRTNPGVGPSFAARSVAVTEAPTTPLNHGDSAAVTLSGVNLTSLGSPEHTTLVTHWEWPGGFTVPLVSDVPVSNGTASFAVPIPGLSPAPFSGASTLTSTAALTKIGAERFTRTAALTTVDTTARTANFTSGEIVVTLEESGTTVRIPVELTSNQIITPPNDKPTRNPSPTTDDQLTEHNKNLISVSPDVVSPGDTITAYLGGWRGGGFDDGWRGGWTSVWMHSSPTIISDGWVQVSSAGTVSARIPLDTEHGKHRIVVLDSEDQVIGWDEITVVAGKEKGRLSQTGSEFGAWTLGALVLLAVGTTLIVRRRKDNLTH